TITIDPASVGGSINGGTTVCKSGSTTTLTLVSKTGNVVKWQYYTDAATLTDTTDITNTSTSHTVLNLQDQTYYRAQVKSGACPAVYSSAATIAVSDTVSGGAVSIDAGSTAIVPAGTNSTNLTLNGYTTTASIAKWQWSSTSDFASANDIANTTTSYTATNLTSSRWYRAVIVNGACTSYSTATKITVDAVSVGGKILGTKSICTNSSASLTLNGYTGTSLQWESSSDNINFSPIPSETLVDYTTPPLTQQRYYRVAVTNGTSATAYSDTATILINDISLPGTASSDTTVCISGSTVTLRLTDYRGTSIQWQQSATFNGTYTNVSGSSTGATLTIANLQATTYYRAVVTNGPCQPATSNVVTVTVSALANGGSVTGGTTVCTGTNSTLLTLSNYTSNVLRWEYSTSRTFASGVTAVVNTTDTFTANNLTATTYFR
ncbi:MAG: hypothetical protein ACKO6K_03250, partial [Chitinophagaceae bacterium]